LVIETSLYYDARSEKHQITQSANFYSGNMPSFVMLQNFE